MLLNKYAFKYLSIGLIMLVMAMNIPDIQVLIDDKIKIAQPKALQAFQFAYDNVSMAIVPLIGKITDKPTLFINNEVVSVDTANNFRLDHGQSLSIDQINTILEESPAIGTGKYWIDNGIKYNIDAAYMLSIFYYESGFATNKGWAGYKDNGTHTYNIGNMICAGYTTCYGRFRDYSNASNPWYAGIEDNTKNLAYYRDSMGIETFDDALMTWAPPVENNTQAYITGARNMINAWRSTNRIVNADVAQAVSAPITVNTDDGFGFNVKAALDANNGALRSITIQDGQQWSFNETVGNPADMGTLRYVAGIYGGGWCDLACRYIQVLKGLGLEITHGTDRDSNDMVFLQHGGIALYNCSYDESPYIWSAGNKGFDGGMQDLIVNNRTGKTIKLAVVDNADGTATVIGYVE